MNPFSQLFLDEIVNRLLISVDGARKHGRDTDDGCPKGPSMVDKELEARPTLCELFFVFFGRSEEMHLTETHPARCERRFDR